MNEEEFNQECGDNQMNREEYIEDDNLPQFKKISKEERNKVIE